MERRLTLRKPIVAGIVAVLLVCVALVTSNVVFTRHYLLVSETEGVPGLGPSYWLVLGMVDVFLAGAIVILVSFIVSNARQILLMRRQDSFVDGVTHELKSPLAALRLGLDTLERPNVPTEVRDTLMEQMRGDVDRLQVFIEHILEAGRLQNRERALEREPLDVPLLVRRCIEQIARRHDVSLDRFRVHGPATCVTVTDPVAFEVAVLNLLDNAVKYSPEGAPVEVTVRTGPTNICVDVSDAGVGLARRELKLVFNRFYRVAQTRRVRGTGLGLFVSRGLIRQLGGDIRAYSDGLGSGSRFELSVPLVSPN